MRETPSSGKKPGNSRKRIWGLVIKELRLLLKDKFAMIIIFALPIILVISVEPPPWGAGTGGGGEGSSSGTSPGTESDEKPRIGYIDLDQSEGMAIDLSAEMVNIMLEMQTNGKAIFVLGDNITGLDRLLGVGLINAYIVLPDGLEHDISKHFPGVFTVKFDTLNSIILEKAQSVVTDLQKETKARFGLTGVFDQQITEVGMPDHAQNIFQTAPIFFPLTIFAIAALTTAQSIVADVPKDRMLLTPASRLEIVTAKLIANEFMIIAQSALLTGLSYGLVGLTTIGSPFLLFGILAFIGLSGVCLGLAISAIVKTPLSALQFFIFIFLFQMIIMLFLQDPVILSIFPMYNGMALILNQVMRGESFFVSGILPTLYTLAWILGFFILSIAVFYRRKPLL